MQNGNDHFVKIEAKATTRDNEKLQSETNDQNNRNSKNKYGYCHRGRYRQCNRWFHNKISNLSNQTLTEGQIELLNNIKLNIRNVTTHTQHTSRCRNLKKPLIKI